MSGQGFEELLILNRKLDELLDRYNNLKREVEDLRSENKVLKTLLHDKEEKINELEIKYERVKLSGALMGGSDDANEAKKKITELAREIDRCAALLNR